MSEELLVDEAPEVKRVRFSVVEEFEYEVEDFTEEEIALLWYTMEEMVDLVKHELHLNETESKKQSHSWRGLEHMQGGVDNRAERVQQICDAILDAYDDLCEDSSSDEKGEDMAEKLRNECRTLTREDRKRAYKYGLRDQAVAESLQKDGSPNKRRHGKESGKGSSSGSSSSKESKNSMKEARRKRVRSGKDGKEGSSSSSSGTKKNPLRKSKNSTSNPATPPLRMNPIAA